MNPCAGSHDPRPKQGKRARILGPGKPEELQPSVQRSVCVKCESLQKQLTEKSAKYQIQKNGLDHMNKTWLETKRELAATETACLGLKERLNAMSQENKKLKDQEPPRAQIEGHVLQKRVADLESLLSQEKAQSLSLQEELLAVWEENEQLKAQLRTRKSQKSVSGLSHGASWQFAVEDRWEAFTPEANETMHEAYLEFLQKPCSRYVTITSGGVDRQIDFQLMKQKHLQTQRVRSIRLIAGVPDEWVTSPAALLQQSGDLGSFFIEVANPLIWEAIQDILQGTGHAWDASKPCSCMSKAEIKSVHRIENFHLWHRYKARLSTMRQDHARYGVSVGSAELDLDGKREAMTEAQDVFDCDEPLSRDVDETILLHGTSRDKANSIVREGFDHRTCQSGFYGAGVYFACAACKSHQYTCEQHKQKCCQCKDERTLIIARVALGDSYTATETRRQERRPPLRGGGAGTYDSIVVKPGPIRGHHHQKQTHQEFVIFDREQAYPCYVVRYIV